jgi:hypothetical protein
MAVILETGELVFEGIPFSEPVHVVNGSILRYGENQEDTGVAYLKDVGGIVKIDAGKNLISNSCTLNGASIADNSVGAAFYIDEIGVGGSWTVTGGASGYVNLKRRQSHLGKKKAIKSK